MKKVNYLGLVTVEWGLDFYNSTASIHTTNKLLQWLIGICLKMQGFKEVKP